MVEYELLRDEGILVIRPKAALDAEDFQRVSQEIDPYIEANGMLHGVMIDAPSFPGWADFGALLAHLKFVRDHHRRIEKVAAVSDGQILAIAPQIAGHFVQANVRHFTQAQKDEALVWLSE